MQDETCPLCQVTDIRPFFSHELREYGHQVVRSYWLCSCCGMVFSDRKDLLTPEEEKSRYLEHNNDPEDVNYRQFLSRAWEPLKAHLKPEAKGLDYGCGPEPVLANMAESEGYSCQAYDPYFSQKNITPLSTQFDFITCTEAAEHFYHPHQDFHRMDSLLKPGGHLVVMSQFLKDTSFFEQWPYHRDPTHVAFYQEKTLNWIARRWNWRLDLVSPSVALFQKNKVSQHYL